MKYLLTPSHVTAALLAGFSLPMFSKQAAVGQDGSKEGSSEATLAAGVAQRSKSPL